MGNEEFEKKMGFILEHQAQFAASIQEDNARFARLVEHVGQLEDVVNRLAAVTLAGFKDVNAKIDVLVDSQIRLADAQARTDETQHQLSASLARLAEAQERMEENQGRTDVALRNLIATVERHINERRKGEQK